MVKLYEVMYGPQDEYVVYKVSSPNTDEVYYGYSKGKDIRDAFLAGANRQDEPDRGDVKMINRASGVDNLKFTELELYDNEFEAWQERNQQRADDSMSITGPTNFPASMFQRAKQLDPGKVDIWFNPKKNPNNMTAREAMAAGHLSYPAVKALGTSPALVNQIKQDLDKLKFPDFKRKYGL